MTLLIPSFLSAGGSSVLVYGLDAFHLNKLFDKVPKPSHAAFYGGAVCLSHRVIVYAAKEEFKGKSYSKGETVQLTMVVIVMELIASYAIRDFFGDLIPHSFVHLRTVLYIAALADGEFENKAKKLFPVEWNHHVDHRLIGRFIQRFESIF